MLPDPDKPFEKQDPEILLAMCLWGEARGSGIVGMAAVACVILNRMRLKGKTLAEVILAPKQFSSFNADDPNSSKLGYPLKHDTIQAWERCCTIARLALSGSLVDITKGASHYYADSMLVPPRWARTDPWKETARVGGHIFGITH